MSLLEIPFVKLERNVEGYPTFLVRSPDSPFEEAGQMLGHGETNAIARNGLVIVGSFGSVKAVKETFVINLCSSSIVI